MQQLPVAGYFRVSQARDGMKAPDLYEDEIRRYCSYRSLVLGQVFSDIDYSAYKNSENRPALNELVRRRHEFSAIVVPKLSRFGRSLKHLTQLFDAFDSDGIALVFLDLGMDTSTSQGRLLRNVMGAFAEYESDVKADYSRANLRLIAEAGRPHGPIAPYGYTVVGKGAAKTYVVDEARAAIVVEIFERYASGAEGFSVVARDLNVRGITGVKGGRWARERIRTLIDNPSYVALRRHNGETFPAAWPPIVEQALWERVRARRAANRQVQRRAPERGLLAGLLACGLCGRRLHNHASHDRRRAYECRGSLDYAPRCLGGQILADRAERLVSDGFFELLAMVRDAALAARAQEARSSWSAASVPERRRMLHEAIDQVVLLSRPPGNRHGKGQGTGRSLRVKWATPWSLEVFGFAGASSVIGPGSESIVSPKGKTWAEWRRQLIAAP